MQYDLDEGARSDLDSTTIGLLNRKRDELQQQLKDIVLSLLKMQLSRLMTYDERFTTACFREWLLKYIMNLSYGSALGPCYTRPHRDIASPTPPHQLGIEHYTALCGSSAQSMSFDSEKIDATWQEVFRNASKIVEPLREGKTILKAKTKEYTNLRFMTIEDEELPWKIA